MQKNYYNQYNPKERDLELVFNLMFTQKGEIPYLELSNFEDGENRGFTLPSVDNPEFYLLKKESFQKLSYEAREVIKTILDAPTEITELITTNVFGLYSKKLIKKYFLDKGWKRKLLDNVFNELATFASDLG